MVWSLATPALALNAVTVMADNTMDIAVAEIARHYSRDRQAVVNTSFAPPAAQEAQINEGGAADVLITPSQPWIDKLRTQGLIDIYSQVIVAKNRLVLAGPADTTVEADLGTKFPTAAIITALGWEPGFIIGSPDVLMSGSYAKEALRSMGAAADLEPYTLYLKSLPQMRGMVARRKAYGLFFYSSTVGHEGLRVIDVVPEAMHAPIRYYAVVIAGENMNEARKFLDYMKTAEARRVLQKNGFATD